MTGLSDELADSGNVNMNKLAGMMVNWANGKEVISGETEEPDVEYVAKRFYHHMKDKDSTGWIYVVGHIEGKKDGLIELTEKLYEGHDGFREAIDSAWKQNEKLKDPTSGDDNESQKPKSIGDWAERTGTTENARSREKDVPTGQILEGNCAEVLWDLPPRCVDLVVTSPPYWGMRSYGGTGMAEWGGDKGCEHEWHKAGHHLNIPTHGHSSDDVDSKEKLDGENVEIDAKRCVKCQCWKGPLGNEPSVDEYIDHLRIVCKGIDRVLKSSGSFVINVGDGYRDKCLTAVPERLALGLMEDDWVFRDRIIWSKQTWRKNGKTKGGAMPIKAEDRMNEGTKEYVMHFTKSEQYYFDNDELRNRMVGTDKKSVPSVWEIATSKKSTGHVAPYPEELVERMVASMCKPGGVVLDPFFGSGTTGRVAANMGREWIGIEANPEYAEIARGRIGEGVQATFK